eukprot:COSAG01_NODE_3164_length_6477_cov_6.494983_4_plen_93_part_00
MFFFQARKRLKNTLTCSYVHTQRTKARLVPCLQKVTIVTFPEPSSTGPYGLLYLRTLYSRTVLYSRTRSSTSARTVRPYRTVQPVRQQSCRR